MTGDLQDAMKMLSSIFHRILKINLSTDTYTVIRGKDSTVSMLPSLSESLKMMADYKYIYEEDQEEYLKFCSGYVWKSSEVQNINRMTRLP